MTLYYSFGKRIAYVLAYRLALSSYSHCCYKVEPSFFLKKNKCFGIPHTFDAIDTGNIIYYSAFFMVWTSIAKLSSTSVSLVTSFVPSSKGFSPTPHLILIVSLWHLRSHCSAEFTLNIYFGVLRMQFLGATRFCKMYLQKARPNGYKMTHPSEDLLSFDGRDGLVQTII